jgi:hypothetical protein
MKVGWVGDAEIEAASSDKHTARHPQEVEKKTNVMRRVLWLSWKHSSVLQEAHCQPSARDGEV